MCHGGEALRRALWRSQTREFVCPRYRRRTPFGSTMESCGWPRRGSWSSGEAACRRCCCPSGSSRSPSGWSTPPRSVQPAARAVPCLPGPKRLTLHSPIESERDSTHFYGNPSAPDSDYRDAPNIKFECSVYLCDSPSGDKAPGSQGGAIRRRLSNVPSKL